MPHIDGAASPNVQRYSYPEEHCLSEHASGTNAYLWRMFAPICSLQGAWPSLPALHRDAGGIQHDTSRGYCIPARLQRPPGSDYCIPASRMLPAGRLVPTAGSGSSGDDRSLHLGVMEKKSVTIRCAQAGDTTSRDEIDHTHMNHYHCLCQTGITRVSSPRSSPEPSAPGRLSTSRMQPAGSPVPLPDQSEATDRHRPILTDHTGLVPPFISRAFRARQAVRLPHATCRLSGAPARSERVSYPLSPELPGPARCLPPIHNLHRSTGLSCLLKAG